MAIQPNQAKECRNRVQGLTLKQWQSGSPQTGLAQQADSGAGQANPRIVRERDIHVSCVVHLAIPDRNFSVSGRLDLQRSCKVISPPKWQGRHHATSFNRLLCHDILQSVTATGDHDFTRQHRVFG